MCFSVYFVHIPWLVRVQKLWGVWKHIVWILYNNSTFSGAHSVLQSSRNSNLLLDLIWISVSVFFPLWGQTCFEKCGKIRMIQRILKHHETIFLTQGELPYMENTNLYPFWSWKIQQPSCVNYNTCTEMFLVYSISQRALFYMKIPYDLIFSKLVFSCFILFCGQTTFQKCAKSTTNHAILECNPAIFLDMRISFYEKLHSIHILKLKKWPTTQHQHKIWLVVFWINVYV